MRKLANPLPSPFSKPRGNASGSWPLETIATSWHVRCNMFCVLNKSRLKRLIFHVKRTEESSPKEGDRT
jgi:hypothetical protein